VQARQGWPTAKRGAYSGAGASVAAVEEDALTLQARDGTAFGVQLIVTLATSSSFEVRLPIFETDRLATTRTLPTFRLGFCFKLLLALTGIGCHRLLLSGSHNSWDAEEESTVRFPGCDTLRNHVTLIEVESVSASPGTI
jgi:hypothetical protein